MAVSWLSLIGLLVAFIVVVAVLFIRCFDGRRRYFVYFMKMMRLTKNPIVDRFKKELFSKLNEQRNNRKGGEFTIVELGAGTGANFEYFPNDVSIIVVDPNRHFRQPLEERVAAANAAGKNLKLTGFYYSYAEDMSDVPDNSVDAVVTTLVLCSVEDTEKALREIYRVLKPGGRYYSMEHVVSKTDENRRWWQTFWSNRAIWRFCGDGCRLDRDPATKMKKGLFSDVQVQEFDAEMRFLTVCSPHINAICLK